MLNNNTEELAQNKLILLYIIKKAPFHFTKSELNEFILKNNYMNYFFLQQYLRELLDSNFIQSMKSKNDKIYKISKKGDIVLNYFDHRIPDNLKEHINNEFNSYKLIEQKKTEVVSDFYPKENGQYIVNIRLVENNNVLFSLYLDVPSLEQAKSISDMWKNNTNEIYMNIMNMFMNE